METLEAVKNESIDSNDDDLKAQEKLNQRREARRRKILENAKNRLEKLNSRTTTITTSSPLNNSNISATINSPNEHHRHKHLNGPTHLDSVEFSDPEVEPDIIFQQFLQNASLPSMDTPTAVDSSHQNEISELLSSLLGGKEASAPQKQKRHILLRARLHLIVSALIACISTFVLRETIGNNYSIFIPAGLCVVIDLLFFREQQPINPLISLAITMLNIRLPSQTQNILHLFSIIQSLIVDLGVFIFSFCIFSFSLVFINNSFVDLIVN